MHEFSALVLCTVVGIERMVINTMWIFKAAVNEVEFERNIQSEKKWGGGHQDEVRHRQ